MVIKHAIGLIIIGVVLTSVVHFFIASHSFEISSSVQSKLPLAENGVQETLIILNSTLAKLRSELKEIKSSSTSLGGKQEHEPSKTVTSKEIRYPPKRAVIFTMDTIDIYIQQSSRGGAAGELVVRNALESVLHSFNIQTRTIASDTAFEQTVLKDYDLVFLDPWTWAAKGWVPKPGVEDVAEKVFILDFFGHPSLRNKGIKGVGPEKVLTAYPTPWNTFLGFYLPDDRKKYIPKHKVFQGVIWGKDPKYLADSAPLLAAIAAHVPLVSTAPSGPLKHPNVTYLGPQSPEQWRGLLGRSAFLLSLGHPLLGPSAIEAVSLGCVYVNTIYKEALSVGADKPISYTSQHPYLGGMKNNDFVCEYVQGDKEGARKCVDHTRTVMAKYSANAQSAGFLPSDYTYENYSERVRTIFRIEPE